MSAPIQISEEQIGRIIGKNIMEVNDEDLKAAVYLGITTVQAQMDEFKKLIVKLQDEVDGFRNRASNTYVTRQELPIVMENEFKRRLTPPAPKVVPPETPEKSKQDKPKS